MHTPGPWHFEPILGEEGMFHILTPNPDYLVRGTPGCLAGKHLVIASTDSEQDARLIASAPKLLEALEAVARLNQWRRRSPEWLENPSCRVELCAAIDNAEFAIAEAKGE